MHQSEIKHNQLIDTILNLKDQVSTTTFHHNILRKTADLNVQGRIELILAENCKLGLLHSVPTLQKNYPHSYWYNNTDTV